MYIQIYFNVYPQLQVYIYIFFFEVTNKHQFIIFCNADFS